MQPNLKWDTYKLSNLLVGDPMDAGTVAGDAAIVARDVAIVARDVVKVGDCAGA